MEMGSEEREVELDGKERERENNEIEKGKRKKANNKGNERIAVYVLQKVFSL